MHKVDSLDDVLLSPVSSKMTSTSLVAPVVNSDWLPDPYTTGYSGTYNNMYSRASCEYIGNLFSTFIHYSLALRNHVSVDFFPPKRRPKSKHWLNSQHSDKSRKHRSKDKKRRRPHPILMHIVGEALTLQCKELSCCTYITMSS